MEFPNSSKFFETSKPRLAPLAERFGLFARQSVDGTISPKANQLYEKTRDGIAQLGRELYQGNKQPTYSIQSSNSRGERDKTLLDAVTQDLTAAGIKQIQQQLSHVNRPKC